MKKLLRLLILPSVFLFCSSSLAANNKCQILKKNAKKAKSLYSLHKKRAYTLGKQVKVLKKDKKRIPTNVQTAHRLINHEIHKLSTGNKKRLAISQKYWQQHIQLKKAVKRNCARILFRPKRFDGFKYKKVMSLASH